MQGSHEASSWYLIAGEHASRPLDAVDEAFDDVAFAAAGSVIAPRLLATAAGRDDHLYLFGCEQFSPRVGTVAFIGDNSVKMDRREQRFSVGEVMAYSAGQDEL